MLSKSIYLIFIALFVCSFSFGQQEKKTKPDTSVQPQSKDAGEILLEYEKTLKDEQKADMEFTQKYYDTILKLLGAIVVVGGGIFTWLNWKSKEDIKKQVNEQFKEKIQAIMDEKLSQIDEIIRNGKEKSAKQFEDINKIILELSVKSNKIGLVNSPDIDNNDNIKKDVTGLANKEILWVDDHPRNNDYPRQILGEAGIKFTMALSTEEAMKILESKKFDLIISDLGRGSNRTAGLELITQIKENKITTPIVIYASQLAIKNFGAKATELGAVAVTSGYSGVLSTVQGLLL